LRQKKKKGTFRAEKALVKAVKKETLLVMNLTSSKGRTWRCKSSSGETEIVNVQRGRIVGVKLYSVAP